MVDLLSKEEVSGASLSSAHGPAFSRVNELISSFMARPTLGARMIAASDSLNLETDAVIIVDTTAGDVPLVLPSSAPLPLDGRIYRYWVHHIAGGNRCVVSPSGGFSDGLATMLPRVGETVQLGVMSGMPWMRISQTMVTTKARRSSVILPGDFAVPTPVQFESVDFQDNAGVISCDPAGANPERLSCGYGHRYKVGFVVEVESTGGGDPTYNVTCEVHRNGVLVPGMHITTGDNRNRECSASLPNTPIDLAAGDRLELVVSHTGLGAGGITGAWLQATATL